MRLLTPQNILAQMGHRLELLVGGPKDVPARQQTLRSTIDWSYDLLDAQEKDLFQSIAVFVGGCTLEAVEAVGNISPNLNVLSALESLVDKNLSKPSEAADELRFGMLETIREYALERLIDRGEVETSRQRHATFFLELAEAARPHMYGPREALWVKRLEAEHDNLRAALAWSIENATDIALRLAGSLGRFWHLHAHHSEGRRWLVKALTKSEDNTTGLDSFRARAFNQASVLSYFMGDTAQAFSFSERSVNLWRQVGDTQGLALALCDLGVAMHGQGHLARARVLLEESISLFRQLKEKRGLVRSVFWHGHVTYRQHDYAKARMSAEESITLAREIGDTSNMAAATSTLGRISFQQGDFSAAQLYFEKSLQLFREAEDKPGIAIVLDCLGNLAYTQDDCEKAKSCFEESSVIWRELGSQPDVAWLLCHLGYIALHLGNQQRAMLFFEESLALNRALDNRQGIARCLAGLAGIAAAAGQPARATRLFGATETRLVILDTQLGYIKKDMCDRIATTIQAEYERTMAAARAKIPEADFEAAYAEGQAMSLEQAITYAGQKQVSEE
jgi:tetratricopeptide (TPR) repeat protein